MCTLYAKVLSPALRRLRAEQDAKGEHRASRGRGQRVSRIRRRKRRSVADAASHASEDVPPEPEQRPRQSAEICITITILFT
jgi:hypothetical protein